MSVFESWIGGWWHKELEGRNLQFFLYPFPLLFECLLPFFFFFFFYKNSLAYAFSFTLLVYVNIAYIPFLPSCFPLHFIDKTLKSKYTLWIMDDSPSWLAIIKFTKHFNNKYDGFMQLLGIRYQKYIKYLLQSKTDTSCN